MRVVYLYQYFKKPSAEAAGSSRAYQMARRIAARGHEVHLITMSSSVDSYEMEKLENFNVHWIPGVYSNLMSVNDRLKSFLGFAFKSCIVAFRLNGDVVFASSTPLTVAIPGVLVSRLRRKPLVFEVRDLWPAVPIAMGALKSRWMRRLAESLEGMAYRSSSNVVALSPDMKDGITATGVSEGKVTVIPNASDNEVFEGHDYAGQRYRKEEPWLGERKLVFYGGTIGHVNDVSYLARLAAKVATLDPEIRFLVVGSGNEEEHVRRTAKELGVYDVNFFMRPRVPKTEVPMLFAAADLAVSTVAPISILAANSANKIFDAFASGTPAMINHGGWLAKLLDEREAGLALDPLDLSDAARRLVAYLNDDDRLAMASHNAKQLALHEFNRDRLAGMLGDVLEAAYEQSCGLKRGDKSNLDKNGIA